MSTLHARPRAQVRPALPTTRRLLRRQARAPYVLSALLGLVAGTTALAHLVAPSLIAGSDVLRGNLLGTSAVVLPAAVLHLLAQAGTARGSARWLVVWGGTTAYLLYQAVLFCFATPFNDLFLLYVAQLGLGVWTALALGHAVDLDAFTARVHPRMPLRSVAAVALAFTSLNGLAWVARVVPTIGSEDPMSVFDGTGLLTSPVWVQDLAFWVPATLVAGTWMWRGRPRGVLLTGMLLVFFVVESVSIAADQWWGYAEDPTLPDFASMGAVWMFAVAAVLTMLPVAVHLRHLDRALDRG